MGIQLLLADSRGDMESEIDTGESLVEAEKFSRSTSGERTTRFALTLGKLCVCVVAWTPCGEHPSILS